MFHSHWICVPQAVLSKALAMSCHHGNSQPKNTSRRHQTSLQKRSCTRKHWILSYSRQSSLWVSDLCLWGASEKWDVVSLLWTSLFSASLKRVHTNSASISEAFNAIPKFVILWNDSVWKLWVILSLKNQRIGSGNNKKHLVYKSFFSVGMLIFNKNNFLKCIWSCPRD